MSWTSDLITEVVIKGLWTNGRPVVNILHVFRLTDSIEESARRLLDAWQDHIVGDLLMNNYSLQGADYRDRNVTDGQVGELLPDTGKPTVGGRTVEAAPPNSAILVHKLIQATVGTRSGRMYLTGVAEGDVDENGAMSTGQVAFVDGQLADFRADVDFDNGSSLTVVHVPPSGTGSATASTVNGLKADPLVATQRRRLRG